MSDQFNLPQSDFITPVELQQRDAEVTQLCQEWFAKLDSLRAKKCKVGFINIDSYPLSPAQEEAVERFREAGLRAFILLEWSPTSQVPARIVVELPQELQGYATVSARFAPLKR